MPAVTVAAVAAAAVAGIQSGFVIATMVTAFASTLVLGGSSASVVRRPKARP